jgi:uncharacterized protein (UPF0335 family)
MAASLASGGTLGATQVKQAKAFKERLINLHSEQDELKEQISEVYNEAREAGFDPKIMRKAIKRLRSSPADLKAEEEMIDAYVSAMGGLPLFEAAAAREEAAASNPPLQ